MKKLIALMFAVLFLGAGIATASDLSMTGKYTVRGQYFDNWPARAADDSTPAPAADDRTYALYDHEMTLDSQWKMDDTTYVFARFNIRDQSWGTNGDTVTEGAYGESSPDDNIEVQQVWGITKFANGISLKTGLMAAGAWGSDFGNTSTEAFRIFVTVPTQVGAVIGILEKPNAGCVEQGSPNVGESNDMDVYHIAMVTKFGDVNVKPIVSFIDANNQDWSADSQTILAQLSLDGKAGMIGYEADFSYRDVDRTEVAAQDYQLFGAYANVWYQMQALKIGAFAAYGSWDDDAQQGYDFGDDFAPGKLLLMGDDLLGEGAENAGSQTAAEGGMMGATLFGIYGEYAVTDKLSLNAVVALATTDRDQALVGTEGTELKLKRWDNADIFELSGGFAYKITPSLTYDGGIGMATVDYGDDTIDPDTLVEAFHRLSFAF